MWRSLARLGDRIRELEIGWQEYVLVVGIGMFAILRIIYSLPRFSDGNIYLYLSYLISQGAVPYRDFFFSSPPLIPYLLTFWGIIFGFNWSSFNVVPLLLTVVDALLIYCFVWRHWSREAALVSSLVYLLSFTTLATTGFVSDVHLVTTLILTALLALDRKLFAVSGILLGLSVLAKLYAVVMVAGLAVYLLWRQRWRTIVSVGIAFSVVTGAVILFFAVWTGTNFTDAVITSHMGSVGGLSKQAIFSFFIKHDWFLLLPLLAWPWARKTTPDLLFVLVAFYLAFMLFFQDVYYLYFKVLVTVLALLWGWAAEQLLVRYKKKAVIGVLALVAAVSVTNIWRYVGEQSDAAVVKGLPDIVDYVRRNSGDGDEIYGSFEVAPLVALEAGRPIFNNYVDTNVKFYQTGWFDMGRRMNEIVRGKVAIIITKGLITNKLSLVGGYDNVLPKEFFKEYCPRKKIFPIEKDYSSNAVVVWKCEYK